MNIYGKLKKLKSILIKCWGDVAKDLKCLNRGAKSHRRLSDLKVKWFEGAMTNMSSSRGPPGEDAIPHLFMFPMTPGPQSK